MRQKPKYLRYCLKCGKEMLIQEWRLKRGVGKFCSQSCSISYVHKGLPIKESLIKTNLVECKNKIKQLIS